MKTMKRAAAILFVLVLAAGAACADTLNLNGTVEAGVTVPVYAPIGGTVVILRGSQGQIEGALQYLEEKNIGVEVLRSA